MKYVIEELTLPPKFNSGFAYILSLHLSDEPLRLDEMVQWATSSKKEKGDPFCPDEMAYAKLGLATRSEKEPFHLL